MNRNPQAQYMQDGETTTQQFLLEALIQVESQVRLYQQLLSYAPNDLSREYLLFLIEEGTSNVLDIKKDYGNNFGPVPPYDIRQYTFADYRQGLLAALDNQINTIRFARDFSRQLAMTEGEYPDILEGFRRGVTSGLVQQNILTLLFTLAFYYYYQ